MIEYRARVSVSGGPCEAIGDWTPDKAQAIEDAEACMAMFRSTRVDYYIEEREVDTSNRSNFEHT